MRISYAVLLLFLVGCSHEPEDASTLFTLLDHTQTQVDFSNTLESEDDFNIITYLYFYDGGGVAIGDVNNDHLPDLFLTGNQVPDRLYLNRGDFRFDDVTQSSMIQPQENTWSTGVTMADVNGDGWIDIYVCKVNHLSKTGHNLLYINQKDGTFTEESQRYGLDFEGLSTHAIWLDYDLDGDLDLYLLNHSIHSRQSYVASWRRIVDAPKVGDKLYRQDDGFFVSVTLEAGIYSSALGYGLGIASSDLNLDGWPDLYVGNDFHEDDYLYLNSSQGTFTESLWQTVGATSRSTMGIDIADLNNDGLPDIVALDMLPPDLFAQRTVGNTNADALMKILDDFGYGTQLSRNTLQLHRGMTPEGIPFFSEIGAFAGIEATDWSWAPLLADFDGDGWKDIYVTNGIPRRPNDLDYIEYVATPNIQQILQQGTADQIAEIVQRMPTAIVPNYAFKGGDDLMFEDMSTSWGLDESVIGNGAAYADLDLDGDPDLVINTLNHPTLIYRNESTNNYISIVLRGKDQNTSAIGAKVHVWVSGTQQLQEQFLSRGFQSSVDHVLHFGIGSAPNADSVIVTWPSKLQSNVGRVAAGARLTLHEIDGKMLPPQKTVSQATFQSVRDHGITFVHVQDEVTDHEILPILPYWRSTRGAALAVADVNGDGLEDVYLGGARDQPGALYLQSFDGSFRSMPFPEIHRAMEEVDALFFDADGDEDQDLYVVGGGWTKPIGLHQDQLYINSGSGHFQSAPHRLPKITSNGTEVAAADYDFDGDIDLFVGSDTSPGGYGMPGNSYLLENDGAGYFADITNSVSSSLQQIGHVTGVAWVDLVGDSFLDLVLVGEWMPITIFENRKKDLLNRTDSLGLSNTAGLWQSLIVDDINRDGYPDIVAGNLGLNSVLEVPIALYVEDFDLDGRRDPIIAHKHHQKWYPWPSRDPLLQQMPSLSARIPTYHAYKELSMTDLFGDDMTSTHTVETLQSMIFWNDGGRHFIHEEMPDEVQWAPVMAMEFAEIGGKPSLFVAGNLSATSDAYGAMNAGWGTFIQFSNSGDIEIPHNSGFRIPGETRQIHLLEHTPLRVIVARSNNTPILFEQIIPHTTHRSN